MATKLTEGEKKEISDNLKCAAYKDLVDGTMEFLCPGSGQDRYMRAIGYFCLKTEQDKEPCTSEISRSPIRRMILLSSMSSDDRFRYAISAFGVFCKCEEKKIARQKEERLHMIENQRRENIAAKRHARAEKKYLLELEMSENLEEGSFFAMQAMFSDHSSV